jgi:hypothetical protein
MDRVRIHEGTRRMRFADILGALSEVCAGLPDQCKGSRRDGDYSMADIGLSAFSIFFMGSPSFLGHQRAQAEGHGRSNCETLFGMSAIPLRQLHPHDVGRCRAGGVRWAVHQGDRGSGTTDAVPVSGRAGGDRAQWDRALLLAQDQMRAVFDAAAFRWRHRILPRLPGCQPGRTRPPAGQVLPLPPEFIAPQDGAERPDCECNAAKRSLTRHGTGFAYLRPVFLGYDLFACQPIVTAILDAGGSFILTCKPSSHQTIAEYLYGAELQEHRRTICNRGKRSTTFTAGSTLCRCAPPATPSWSTGSPSRPSTPKGSALTTIAWLRISRSHPTPSPNWPPAAAPGGRSKTRPSTRSGPTVTISNTTLGTAREPSPAS